MTRRRKEQSILEVAIHSEWTVSALLAIGTLLLTLVVVPAITSGSPVLRAVGSALRPLGLFVAGVFALISVLNFFRSSSATRTVAKIHTASSERSDYLGRRVEPVVSAPSPLDQAWTASAHPNAIDGSQDKPTQWSIELLTRIEWKRFEDLSCEYYRVKGIRCEVTALGPDGGIDLKLFQEGSDKPTALVQCKAWSGRFVGVDKIRELRGVIAHEKIEKGFFMTTSAFSDEAKAFATANRITLIDGRLFLAMIARLPAAAQQQLLAFATEGDYTTPSCPSCGVKMIKRESKRGVFWGCRHYPRCRQMLGVKRETYD